MSKVSNATRIGEFLGETARREKRNLLLVSTVGMAVGFGNIVPTKISALGLTVEDVNSNALLWLLFGVHVYLLIAFVVYARADYLASKLLSIESETSSRLERLQHDILGDSVDQQNARGLSEALYERTEAIERMIDEHTRSTWAFMERRFFFDLFVPMLVASIAMASLVMRVTSATGAG